MSRTLPTKTIPFLQNPSRMTPHSRWLTACWIVITPREITSQTTVSRGLPVLGKKGTIFRLLAPEEIPETQNHEWAEYDSLQKRLADKVKEFAKVGEEARALGNLVTGIAIDTVNPNKTAKDILNTFGSRAGTSVTRAKVDTPLVYHNSQRRSFLLTFTLANLSAEDDIVQIVKLFQQYAAAEAPGAGSIFYDPPYVFNLKSYPDTRLIDMPYAALESVQATYKAPFKNGMPSTCELNLEFKDIEPLFANTIKTHSLIDVVTEGIPEGVKGIFR